jgi:Flp pilus assembly pilin Flp
MRRPVWQGSGIGARVRAESGQTMAEYATVLGVLIIAVVAAISIFSSAVDNKLQSDIVAILGGT